MDSDSIRMPAEWEQHSCCWMAWAVHREWADWVASVKSELSEVIRTIATFESVRLLTSRHELAEARSRFAGGNIEIIEAPVDDIWMRDIAPTFALSCERVVAIDWNFNGWGNTKERPSRPGDQLAKIAEAVFGVPRISVSFVAEGGALITNGEGTLVTTRSCLLNPNRNPNHMTESFIEHELQKCGIHQTIWLEGDPSEPLTSGHVDGYVLFNAPSSVLIETFNEEQMEPPSLRSRDLETLGQTPDANRRTLKLERVQAPRQRYWRFRGRLFAPCYLNAYVANGAVITGCFGDAERDEAAKDALERAFPGRTIMMLKVDHIIAGGGGVRCLTQPMAAI